MGFFEFWYGFTNTKVSTSNGLYLTLHIFPAFHVSLVAISPAT